MKEIIEDFNIIDLNHAKEMLISEGYTCVLCKGDIKHTSTERGVKPLVQWVEKALDVRGFSAADKVIGKATAYLYILLGVRAVYAHVISKSALRILQEHGVQLQYGSVVENIINRKGDGICPFEAAVLEIEDMHLAYAAIRTKMKEMNISVE